MDNDNIKLLVKLLNTQSNFLEILMLEPHFRKLLAKEPSTPSEILEILSKDEYSNVRASVAENENTPSEVLEELSNDKYYDVQLGLASNPNTPFELLEKMEKEIRETYSSDDFLEDIDERLEAILKNPNYQKNEVELSL